MCPTTQFLTYAIFVCDILIFDYLKIFLDSPFVTFRALIATLRKQNGKN